MGWTLLILNLGTAVIMAIYSFFQSKIFSFLYLFQVLLWCTNVVILLIAIMNIGNGLRSIQ